MKKYQNTGIIILLFGLFVAAGCNKEQTRPVATPPSNLQVSSEVSTDGTGNVSFTATANNAATYDYEFGDGVVETGTNGNTTHRYTLAGTNTYTVKVTARGNGGSVNVSVTVTVNVTNTAPVLVWSDEFNADGLPDPNKWGYDIGAGGWGNNEVQYYTSRADNAVVINGALRITLKKESYNGSNYTSARLLTKDRFSFKYGKVEIRAKLPSGGGTWPALWMLGSNIGSVGWPACGD